MIKKEKVFYESIKIDEITCSEDFNEALNELDLIKNKIHNNCCNKYYCGQEYTFFYRLHHFFPANLASILNVAWGTAINRSLGISLPVSRQMPYVLFSIRMSAP